MTEDFTGYQPSEDDLQIYSADLIAGFKRPHVIAYHVPNGGKRHPSVAKKLKRFGTLAGVPDWNCVKTNGITVYLEIKDHKGRQSEAQKAFERECKEMGVTYEVARTPEEIRDFFIRNQIIFDPEGDNKGAAK